MSVYRAVTVPISAGREVAAILAAPGNAAACYVMAHGAGAGMNHPFMAAVAEGLAQRGIATLRYQFPFMEAGSRRPDAPALAHATVRAAVAAAARQMPSVPLVAGGKSFGGRMTSQAQAETPLPGVIGLAFAGFPLHPAGKPSVARAQHLSAVSVPMLFVQGARDALADLALMRGAVAGLGPSSTLKVIEAADHGFHVLVRSGRSDAEAMTELLDAIAAWSIDRVKGLSDAV